jgi:hypothetical protein
MKVLITHKDLGDNALESELRRADLGADVVDLHNPDALLV